ncbi:MAG: hypothetical protein QM831_03170 [Kofleriaceae bacterium]
MRLLVACVCSVVVGCGGKGGAGKELAAIQGAPIEVQVKAPNLIFRTNDPNEDLASDKVQETGPHDRLISIPLAGGAVQDLGRMPMGQMAVGPNDIALVAKTDVVVIENGKPKKIGSLPGDGKSAVWIDGAIVVLTNGVSAGRDCCDLVRMSIQDGSTSQIGKLAGIGDALTAVDGTDSFMTEESTGETIKIGHTGAITPVATPGVGTYNCLSLTEHELWWAARKGDQIVISAMPRAGGSVSTVVEVAEKGTYCAASKSELFYTDGNHIKAIATGGKPRNVVDTKGAPRTLAVDGTNLYWAEDTGKAWSIRTAPIK